MPLYDDYQTDESLEQEGVVRTYGDFWVRLARAGGSNKKYGKVLKQKTEKVRRAIELNKLPSEEADRIMVEVYAEAVVLGWGGEGLVDRNGVAIPFTTENVKRVLTDLPELFAQIQKDAGAAESFKQETLAADAGD